MRRKAFTLIELLVVIAIIAILAAILFPVFARAKEAARKSQDLFNVKQLAIGQMMYLQANEDRFPLAFGKEKATGLWRWDYDAYTPANWPSGPGGDSGYAARIDVSPSHWSNSIYPYIKKWDVYASPTVKQISVMATSAALGTVAPVDSSYTYNGLLTSYNATHVASVAQLPLIWNGRGKVKVKGASLSNPALVCDQPNVGCVYIPSSPSCDASKNGQTSKTFLLSGTMWVFTQGANFAFADGHEKWRRLGAQFAPTPTDKRIDPYTDYDSAGFPAGVWSDGCHAWLFRPDYDFSR